MKHTKISKVRGRTMKKIICIFLFITIIMLSGCIQDKSPGMQNVGYPLEIDKDNSITVKDSYIEDNHLIIELQANLSSYTFNDFMGILVREQVSGSNEISCDYESTIERNGCDIFENATSLDTAYLVFTDNVFEKEFDLTSYVLQFSVKDKDSDGVAHTAQMLITPFS